MKVTHYGSLSRQGIIVIPYSSCFSLHLCIIIIKWAMKKLLNASRDSYTHTTIYHSGHNYSLKMWSNHSILVHRVKHVPICYRSGYKYSNQNMYLSRWLKVLLTYTYVATFEQHLDMEYVSLSWYDIPELDGGLLLTRKLLNQGFLLVKLKSSLRKFYGRHHDLVDRYGIPVSQMTTDRYVPLVHTSWSFPHS